MANARISEATAHKSAAGTIIYCVYAELVSLRTSNPRWWIIEERTMNSAAVPVLVLDGVSIGPRAPRACRVEGTMQPFPELPAARDQRRAGAAPGPAV
jgi:hypothetical protein